MGDHRGANRSGNVESGQWAAAAIVNPPKYTARDWDVPAGSVGLVFRPQDDPAEHEVGRTPAPRRRASRARAPFQAALEINSDLSQRTRWEVLH